CRATIYVQPNSGVVGVSPPVGAEPVFSAGWPPQNDPSLGKLEGSGCPGRHTLPASRFPCPSLGGGGPPPLPSPLPPPEAFLPGGVLGGGQSLRRAARPTPLPLCAPG